jgi:hypothetical protein
METILQLLNRYEAEHEFARQILLPEEDRRALLSTSWRGGYRWFRSPNVVCLEKVRRLKAPTQVLGDPA